ncbi:MAG: HEPN domain-containing protein [Paenibacillaceae bacterium]
MRYSKASDVMLKKAGQKFDLAELSFEKGLYDGCVSALYYSAFQTVTALILLRGESVSNKHTHVRGWVSKNLGLTGLVSPHLVRAYNRLMDHRAEADYSASVSFEKEKVSELIEQVRAFNEEVSLIINKETDANN